MHPLGLNTHTANFYKFFDWFADVGSVCDFQKTVLKIVPMVQAHAAQKINERRVASLSF